MGGDSNPLKVFEKRGILIPEIEVRYYPVSNSDRSEIDYIDIADKYRDYLTSDEYGVTKSDTVNDTSLYVDFYGAVLKQESVLGVPITRTDVMTSYALLAADQNLPTILMEYDYPKLSTWVNDGYLTSFDMDAFKEVAPNYYARMEADGQIPSTASLMRCLM